MRLQIRTHLLNFEFYHCAEFFEIACAPILLRSELNEKGCALRTGTRFNIAKLCRTFSATLQKLLTAEFAEKTR